MKCKMIQNGQSWRAVFFWRRLHAKRKNPKTGDQKRRRERSVHTLKKNDMTSVGFAPHRFFSTTTPNHYTRLPYMMKG